MKTRNGFLALVLAVVLCVGTAAPAVDYAYNCSGLCTGGWSDPASWPDDPGFPDDATDSASITASANICTYSPSSALTINHLELAGTSPTRRTLHIKGAALMVATLDLDDYAELDVDRGLTVTTGTTLAGNVWIDVASATTVDLEDVDVDGATTVLSPTTSGTLKAYDVVIDAEADGASRSLRFRTGTWDIENELSLKSSQSANSYVAKFWLTTGSVTPEFLRLNGGDANTRRVEMDIDRDFTIGTDSEATAGRYTITVAAGKQMNTKKLVLTANDGAFPGDIFFYAIGETAEGMSQGQLVTAQ